MTTTAPPGHHGIQAPSLVQLAADSLRSMILAGEYAPGERLPEERLTERLHISRPPLREAMRLLESEGFIVTEPRKGSRVATLTDQDVFEILTLRTALERLAFELGVPVRDPALLEAPRRAVGEMEECAARQDRGGLVQAGYRFHLALVGIAAHRRLSESYAAIQRQQLLCMARNLVVRETYYEDLVQHAARHRQLLESVESGDQERALTELATHGERSFALGTDVNPGDAPAPADAAATVKRRGKAASE
jgi:DNA-binding GntR family transcriptional regulator